ncbi:MAG TPA: HEPN domain-containing protein [Luteimonas sp.]|nr:HEPN domain-containing protein [Luteimonas sp.]HRO27582.1 HEPN domain-containing protein [Luteimonas sp.]HRP72768.1 HEPN domain-containing protein [Luteimonas sp.]
MTAQELKQRHREIRDAQPEALRLRIHRALSWLLRSEEEVEDPDARFILQWIALNAAYAREFGREESERERMRGFIETLVGLDGQKRLHQALFKQFSGPVRTLIDNRFAFEPFWTAMRTHDSSDRWETSFANGKKAALASVMLGDTAKVLGIVFDRLYVLRNQLVHGGATWNSQLNRAQIADGVAILGTLVPLVLAIMMEHPGQGYGDVLYPVVG